MPDDLDKFKEEFYDALTQIYEKFKLHENEVKGSIIEYRKTVNAAISLLSKELFDFQENDRREREKRQKRQDVKDAIAGAIGCCLILTGCGMIAILLWFVTR